MPNRVSEGNEFRKRVHLVKVPSQPLIPMLLPKMATVNPYEGEVHSQAKTQSPPLEPLNR